MRVLTLGVRILKENLDDVNVLCTGERVSSNTNAQRLTKTNISSLSDGLVCQSSGARDDTYYVLHK